MQDADLGQKVVSQLRDPRPGGPIFLAAPFERTSPEIGDPETELVQCPNVSRHRVVSQEASDDLPQPLPLFGNGVMPSLSNLLLNFLELSPQTVASGLPFDQEATVAACTANEGEPEEVEGLRFSEPAPSASVRREAAKLDQAGLLRVK